MKPLRISLFLYLLVPILSLLFISSTAIGQTDTGLQKSAESEAFDQEALKKLRTMSEKEVGELDKKLAQALTLFYDREYARALPIFREISHQIETMDVLFWFASATAKAGETDLALEKFKKMLEVDPALHRVRLEVATVYFQLGKYKEARQELNTVLDAEPPDAVKQNILKLVAAIDAKTKRLYTNLRFSTTVQNDSNVSSGPDSTHIFVPQGGTIGPLTETQQEVDEAVLVLNFAGNGLYDFGEKGSWMLNTTGSFYQTHNSGFTEFDFTQWRVTTGPWWTGKRSVFKMPIGYAENIFGHEHLYDTYDFGGSYEYFFKPWFSLRGMFTYTRDTYEASVPTNDDSEQDNINRISEINPNFYLNNRRDILSFYYSHENLNSKSTTNDRRFTS